MYNDVYEVPMQWNALGVRIPLAAVLILITDAVAAVLGAELLSALWIDNGIIAYAITGVPAAIFALAVIVAVIQLSRLGPLPLLTQFSLLRSTAKQPLWDGLPYDLDEDD